MLRQKGCPVQNTVGAVKFSPPPRSTDFNPVENVFNFVESELPTQVFKKI